jgi:glycosyltransferase involved in cell wall biosynthesis
MERDRPRDECKISVIVLAKNCERFLLECLGSILSVHNVEIVIVDPGSDDRTRNLINLFLEFYPERIVLVDKKDFSPAEGLNNGLARVTGDVIGILNGDDKYLPGALRFVQSYFNAANPADILLMGGIVSNESTWKSKLVYPSRINRRRLSVAKYGGVTFFHQGMFVSHNFAKKARYNIENRVSWDFEYLADLLLSNPRIQIVNNQAAIFRIHPDSISGGRTRLQEAKEHRLRISRNLLGRDFRISDYALGIFYRMEKYLSSSLLSMRDTIFQRNRI